MRWTREEYINLLTFGEVKRPMLVEMFGLLVGLDEEWQAQGAAIEERTLTAFSFDYVERVDCGGNNFIQSTITPSVIEDTKEYAISIDEYGRKTKLIKASATIPLPMDNPVTDMDSWLKIKDWFTFHENRINWDQVELAKKRQVGGALVLALIPGGFDFPRQLMGEEGTCLCYYDNPELMWDILNTAKDTATKIFERICPKLTIDNVCVHEDMAGKSGPLVGPNLIDTFIAPYYHAVWDIAKNHGATLFSQDSDGNMNSVVDSFIKCGVNVMYPAEPRSGMDIVELRKKYGNQLALKGGIDKFALRGTKEDIKKELEYKLQLKTGVAFGLDHRIPNGVPIENYRYYIKTAKEILGINEIDHHFQPMGF